MNHVRAYACAAGIFLLAGAAIAYSYYDAHAEIAIDQTAYYPVTHVMDGDTFEASIGKREITVRLLGVDTPETVDPRKQVQCFGKDASDETKSLLTGHSVQLKLNPDREEKDKYGRYLAYVYVDTGTFLNEFLVSNGYAREYTFGSAYSFQKQFQEDQSQAQKEGKGLWTACPQGTFK